MTIDLQAFHSGFHAELSRLLEENELGQNVDVLQNATSSASAFSDAFARLLTARRPDSDLAKLFLALSELKAISAEARSFAIDCMVYCETDPQHGLSLLLDELRAMYVELAPTLQTETQAPEDRNLFA